MKLKSAIKYYLHDYKKSIIIYYFIIIIVLAIVSLTTSFTDNVNISGIEMASMIFLFVAGLNSFKGQFKFLMQNGVSRKTSVTAFAVSTLVVIIMVILDILIGSIIPYLGLEYNTMFYQIFGTIYSNIGLSYYIGAFIFLTSMYLLVFMLGHIISLLYYRMNTLLKVIVSVSAFLIFNFAGILGVFTEIAGHSLTEILLGMFGYFKNNFNPFIPSVFNLMYFVALALIAYICTKNAKIKA